MIAKLITGLFSFILEIVMTLVQIICLPLNLLFENVFPDFSTQLTTINSALTTAYTGLSWAISIIPPTVRTVLLFIFTVELSILVIMRSTALTSKVWKILQKIKFW